MEGEEEGGRRGVIITFCCRGVDYFYWSLSEGLGKSRNSSRQIQDGGRLKIMTKYPRYVLSSRPVADPKGNIPRWRFAFKFHCHTLGIMAGGGGGGGLHPLLL